MTAPKYCTQAENKPVLMFVLNVKEMSWKKQRFLPLILKSVHGKRFGEFEII